MSLKRDRNDLTQSPEGKDAKRVKSSTNESGRGREGEFVSDAPGREEKEEKLPYPDTRTPFPRSATPTPFQQPTQLITFSYSEKRELLFDDSALRYYVEPPRGAKLDYGYEKWVKQVDERGRIDSLLKALLRVRKDEKRVGMVRELGVVSWRGVMTK